MKNIIKILSVMVVFLLSACEDFDLDKGLDNPNEVTVGSLDVNYLMNNILLEFGDFFNEASEPTMEVTRMMAMTGGDTYERAYIPQSMNTVWDIAYQAVLVNIETLLSKTEGSKLTAHTGVAKVLKAYTLMTLVDIFGDIPYTEAIKGGDGNFNPKVDSGKDVYAAAIKLLEEGVALLAQTPSAGLSRDIYYGGDRTKWTAFANTVLLKAYMNLRLTDNATAKAKITELLTKNLIDTDAEEFTYKYGDANTPTRSRSDYYRGYYQAGAGLADGYIGNHFLFTAYKGKGVEDPRWRYYFYRQVGGIDKALDDDAESIPCIISPRPAHYPRTGAWCAFDPGFFGRDHGNNDGIPPDSRAITAVGVYPFGGRSDTNKDNLNYQVVTQAGQGANGVGIEPIWMSSYTEFLKAEAYLILGITGDAKAAVLSGVKKSIDRVRAFATTKGQALPAGLEADQTAYSDAVAALYDGAATTDAKLDVAMKEFYIALWGNGVESYNMYRRTGKPGDIQPMRSANGGNFPRTFIYPAEFVNLNSSAKQKSDNKVKVFWDSNPDGFVK